MSVNPPRTLSPPSLVGAYRRVDRASEHLTDLKAILDAIDERWKSSDEHMTIYIDLDTRQYRPAFPKGAIPEIPSKCSLLAGARYIVATDSDLSFNQLANDPFFLWGDAGPSFTPCADLSDLFHQSWESTS